MNDIIIEVDQEEEENQDENDAESVKDTSVNSGNSNKKNKGKGNYSRNNQSPNNKKGDNKQNNKNDSNSKEQNNGDKNVGGLSKTNNNSKKTLGNSGEKNDQNFVKQMCFLVEGLCRGRKSYPLDSPFLFLLYRCINVILAKVCLIVWYNLYFRESIVCISGFNAGEKVEDYILNICLSYPYVLDDKEKHRYLLFYRWIPYVLAILFIISYIPRFIMKWFDNAKLHHLLQDLSNACQWYDSSHYKKLEEKLFKYFEENIGTHMHLYFLFVLNHLLAVSLVVAFYSMLDYLLQSRFNYLPFDTIPINRDPQNFTDVLSQTFRPFVKCTIAPPYNMKNEREELYNCHLTLMEFYEKFFYIFWFMLFCYIAVGFLTILVLIILWLPYFNRFYLRTQNKSKIFIMRRNYLLRKLSSGDIFSLYLVKRRTSDSQFSLLINFLYYAIMKRDGMIYEENKSKQEWNSTYMIGFEDRPNLRNRK